MKVEQVVPELTIPPSVTNDRVSTHIIDTSCTWRPTLLAVLPTSKTVTLFFFFFSLFAS